MSSVAAEDNAATELSQLAPAQPPGKWRATGDLVTARSRHTQTLLPNGQVLVAGGFDGTDPLASAELYDPATGVWTATGSMATARYYHTATLLPNGQVLVTSGFHRPPNHRVTSTELYDPASGSWTATASLSPGRRRHTATLLSSGRVLVSGGDSQYGALAQAELYESAPQAVDIE
jgi:hypothetical protein